MKKIFDAKIDKLMEIKKGLDSARNLFLINIVGKTSPETTGRAMARFSGLDQLAKEVEDMRKPQIAKLLGKEKVNAAIKNLMSTQKAYEAGMFAINSTFDAYIKMTFDYSSEEVEKAYAEIRKRSLLTRDARVSKAVEMLAEGEPTAEIAKVLGHKNV